MFPSEYSKPQREREKKKFNAVDLNVSYFKKSCFMRSTGDGGSNGLQIRGCDLRIIASNSPFGFERVHSVRERFSLPTSTPKADPQ